MVVKAREETISVAVEASRALQMAQASLERGDAQELSRALAEVQAHWRAIAPPIPVSAAARYLEVSEPTVRKWLRRGVLNRAPTRPAAVTLESLVRAMDTLGKLRELGRSPDVRELLLARIEDAELLSRPRVARAIAEMDRGTEKHYVHRRES
jgi:hypothetical protein